MSASIQLTYNVTEAENVYKLTVTSVGSDIPSKIFMIEQLSASVAPDVQDVRFSHVAKVPDLSNYPEDTDYDGITPYFRTDSIELILGSPFLLQETLKYILQDVKKLTKAYNILYYSDETSTGDDHVTVIPGGSKPSSQVSAVTFQAVSGYSGFKYDVVYMLGSSLMPCESSNMGTKGKVAGIALSDFNEGDTVTVMQLGTVKDDALLLAQGAPVYVGTNGKLTQDASASDMVYVQRIGQALTSTMVQINIEPVQTEYKPVEVNFNMPIIESGAEIQMKANTAFRHTLQEGETILITTPELSGAEAVTCELWLDMPETAVSFNFDPNLKWVDDAAPDMSKGGTRYVLAIRWDGSSLIGNLAYTEGI